LRWREDEDRRLPEQREDPVRSYYSFPSATFPGWLMGDALILIDGGVFVITLP
jgi:hypothetical protein